MLRSALALLVSAVAVLPAQDPRPIAPVAPVEPRITTNIPSLLPLRYELDARSARLPAGFDELRYLDDFSLASSYSNDLQYSISSAYAASRDAFAAMPSFAMSYEVDSYRQSPRSAWAPDDPADSLYRAARDQLNHGDYRKAAASFAEISRKYPSSVYAADAPYYQAFALYRIGGNTELQEALALLEKYQPASPTTPKSSGSFGGSRVAVTVNSRRGGTSRGDADALAARIASVLSARGMADNAAVKRALSARGDACDGEEQSVRAQALSALMQNDPAMARQLATKILARRDECSIPLRRSALFLVGDQKDAAATATIVNVARTDPSMEVRTEAVTWLGRLPGDAAVAALEEMVRSDTGRIQRVAASVLSSSSSPRARAAMRTLIDRNDAAEELRVAAIDGMRGDALTADDAAFLRGVYARSSSRRVKERIVSVLARVGGEANIQWLTALSRNEDEPIDTRRQVISVLAEKMDVASLVKLYDGSAQGPVRQVVVMALAGRSEPAAVDKLIDIARNGTDASMRRFAISALARSKDPRANKLLLELVDK
ncbi:MAG: HEAT repeat domain-containing protein [Gemmatimonadota bacterium]